MMYATVLSRTKEVGTLRALGFSRWSFRITPKILLHGMLFAAFVGILGGALPARRASRVTLMEALRM
jgi:ABC-type antimicrobial peptide transport system permease subunit